VKRAENFVEFCVGIALLCFGAAALLFVSAFVFGVITGRIR